MNVAAASIDKKPVTYFATALVILAGIAAYFSLGQLEDPNFTVKDAVIITLYPGASPEEVELEVSDRIETKLQELKQIKWVESYSRRGFSYVKVQALPTFWGDDLQTVWDQMRRKIRDIEDELPPGAGRPMVNDDFGDVFGFQLALTGDGFSYDELETFAKEIRRELRVVDGVARVDLWGVQEKIVYIDVKETQLSQLGLSDESIEATLKNQNLVVDAGSVDLQSKRFPIAPTGSFKSPEDIADLVIRPSFIDTLQSDQRRNGINAGANLIRVRDIGTVRRGYREPPAQLMFMNARTPSGDALVDMPAIGISITNKPGVNIVEVGKNIQAKLDELAPFFPIGVDMHRVHWQGEVVDDAVQSFLISFAQALGIVLVVLALAMGWRMGVIVGTALIVTVLGTFIVMSILNIDLHRISLGALVIALGMMVDNSIVVAEGAVVRMQQGKSRIQAAVEAATKPTFPLLAATIIAVMAFFPISGSPESTGEYCQALFQVVGISLLISWIVSLTLTPLQCVDLLKAPKQGAGTDPYGGRFYTRFRNTVAGAIRFRFLTLSSMGGLLALGVVAFGFVDELFFPASSMNKFMVDYFAPEGTRVQDVQADLRKLEEKLMRDERIENVTAYIGSGPPRFYLPVEPEESNKAYGQLIVNVRDFRDIPDIFAELDPWIEETYPGVLVPLRQYGVGPGNTWKFEVRLSGPAVADTAVLREQAKKIVDILEASPVTEIARTNWMQRVQKVVPEYNDQRGRWSAVTRDDIARATKRAYDGWQVGIYRQDDDLIPILMRYEEEERINLDGMPILQVQPAFSTQPVPLAQVTDAIDTEWEESIIRRRDRRRTVKVQANPKLGLTLPALIDSVEEQLNALELPPGYKWTWGGEWEDTLDSQTALVPGIIPAVAVMAFIFVYLYNGFRPLIIITCTLPLVIVGISAGLLLFNAPFGFMALLGAMALAGMMSKNIIVLLDEAEGQVKEGIPRYDAIMSAAVSRLRPVLLAAGTTVLGVIPLLQDVFWVGMAVTIMAGLTFGTVLTMVVVPTLYAALYRLKPTDQQKPAAPSAPAAPAPA